MSDAENQTLLDLDNIDDIDVGSFEAAPDFVEPPQGRYKLGLVVKTELYDKENEDGETEQKKRIRFTYKIVECVELKDKKELVPPEGSMFSETFTVTPEGLKYWKAKAQAILGNLGNATVGEVNAQLNAGVQFLADVKMRTVTGKDKDGNKKSYENVSVRILSPDQDPPFDA